MSDSGAGMQVADFFIRFFGVKKLPWAMLFSGFVIGIPVFFEVGIVILLPLVISIRKTTKQNILLIALPVIAGLSIVHGLVPPHPGAMTAIGIYNANLGKVLLYSLIIALPTAIIAGPVFAKWVHKRVIPENEPELVRVTTVSTDLPERKVSFFIILLPVVLMVLSVVAPYISLPKNMTEFFSIYRKSGNRFTYFMFRSVLFAWYKQGINKKMIKKLTDESLLPVGSIILIIGAGGGFKQILIDSGVGTAIAQMAEHISLSPIVLAFMVAGLIRIATGSATVALTTAAGIVSPVIAAHVGCKFRITRYCHRCRFTYVFSCK